MPMKKKMNRTTYTTSTVVLDDVVGMDYVEFGGSAGLEDCLTVHLAVASSFFFEARRVEMVTHAK